MLFVCLFLGAKMYADGRKKKLYRVIEWVFIVPITWHVFIGPRFEKQKQNKSVYFQQTRYLTNLARQDTLTFCNICVAHNSANVGNKSTFQISKVEQCKCRILDTCLDWNRGIFLMAFVSLIMKSRSNNRYHTHTKKNVTKLKRNENACLKNADQGRKNYWNMSQFVHHINTSKECECERNGNGWLNI